MSVETEAEKGFQIVIGSEKESVRVKEELAEEVQLNRFAITAYQSEIIVIDILVTREVGKVKSDGKYGCDKLFITLWFSHSRR